MSPEIIGFAIILLGVLLLLGKFVRYRWGLTQRLFLPSSIIAGTIALLLGPDVLGGVAQAIGGEEAPFAGGLFGEEISEVWSSLPDLLISIVFATLFLGHRIPRVKQIWAYGGPQLALGVTMGAGQYVVGLLLAVAVLVPVFGLPPMVGALIEVGFEGGHGTAAGLGDTFADLGFEEGADLALGLATVGIVSGVAIGVALINWGVRSGRTELMEDEVGASLARQRGIFEREDREEAAIMTVRPSSIEPLSIHFAIVAVAVVIGAILLEGLQWLEATLWADSIELFEYVPLFPLAMLGGVAVQLLIDRYDSARIVDRMMMLRIQGFALDVLIVAALATLSLEVIAANLVPFLLLAFAGIAWNVSVFLLLAPRIIPAFWFERGIGDLGQSMGVTATGLILMRVVDPQNESPALEAFGYKQLGFEPFLGGGLITALAVPLVAQFGPYPLLAVMTVVTLIAVIGGLRYFGRMDPQVDTARAGKGRDPASRT